MENIIQTSESFLHLAHICIDAKAQQKPNELAQLLEFLDGLKSKKVCVELGSYDGGCLLGYRAIFERVISVDIEQRSNYDIIEYIVCDTKEIVKPLRTALGNSNAKIDFCMIDAGHTYEDVKRDFETILPFMRKGGAIAFHDIVDSQHHRDLNCFVAKFWDELSETTNENFEFHEFVDGGEWGGIGLIKLK